MKSIGLLLFSYEGRIGRAQFWLGWLCALGLTVGVSQAMLLAIQASLHPSTAGAAFHGARMLVGFLGGLLYFVMLFALLVKRNHDRGRNGYWSLLLLVPLVNIWAFIDLGAAKGDEGPNAYGPDPLAATS